MRIKEIDIMKCIAILGIIMVHTAQKFKAMPETIMLLCCFGQMGVQIFFMFSAYSLCLSKNAKTSFINKNYYLKRFLRLVPGYWIGIVLYILVFAITTIVNIPTVLYTNTKPFAIIVNILLLNDLFVEGNNNVVPGGWSISCIWLFYLAFPVIWLIIKKLKKDSLRIAALAFCIIVVPIAFTLIYYLSGGEIVVENNSFIYFLILNQLPAFLMGLLLFIAEGHVPNDKKIKACLAILTAVITLTAVYVFIKGYWWSYFTVTILVAAAAACLFMLLRRCSFDYHEICLKIGKRTYSMFLVHFLFAYYGVSYSRKIILHFGVDINSVWGFIVAYVLIVILSYIAGGWLEKLMDLPLNWYKNKKNI
ncbi:MAG: acyltransferase [Lachnospiraceae bacterium]|nr:acyltransferase [Lachnospiraceae bacterium]